METRTFEKEQLAQSPVTFDEAAHTYTLDGHRLSGVTRMLKRMVFPDMHKGIPQRTLDAAAERGHDIHSQVQMIVEGFGFAKPDLSVTDFFNWAVAYGVEFIASEYLISRHPQLFQWVEDGDTEPYAGYASAIDIIDSRLNLYDIKTTAKFDAEYVRWQLSIYAYLFELQNPTLKANELFGVWLRDGKARVIKVERIDKALIEDLLCAYADGLPWSNPLKPTTDVTDEIVRSHKRELAKLAEVESAIAEIERGKAEYEAKAKELRAGLMKIMEEAGLTKLETERLKLTIVAGSESRIIDSARLKADHPEMWNAYSKTSRKSASLRITLKD